jgi:hypothetical protein
MNRISVRGVGFAAVSMVATVVVWGGLVPAAATSTEFPASPAASAAYLNPFDARTDGAAAELARLRASRLALVGSVSAREAALVHDAARAHASKVAAANAAARRRALAAGSASRTLSRPATPGSARALGQQMAAARGWTGVQFVCLDDLWTRESNWSVTVSNPISGAYGIAQAQPPSKMAVVGSDWRTSATTQITWGLWYIAAAYGNPCSAWAFWQSHNWY